MASLLKRSMPRYPLPKLLRNYPAHSAATAGAVHSTRRAPAIVATGVVIAVTVISICCGAMLPLPKFQEGHSAIIICIWSVKV